MKEWRIKFLQTQAISKCILHSILAKVCDSYSKEKRNWKVIRMLRQQKKLPLCKKRFTCVFPPRYQVKTQVSGIVFG